MNLKNIRERWDIQKDWQLLFPFLGVILMGVVAYIFARRFLHLFQLNNTIWEWPFTILATAGIYYIQLRFFIWCFKKLANKWVVQFRWEMIAIFIVFAITGSISAKLAAPLTNLLGMTQESTNPWIFWPVRIFIILPIYQVLLVGFGWLFGQFTFFWTFEKKMLSRMGLGFLFK